GIGIIGWQTGLPILDILGIVDAHVARAAIVARAHDALIPGHQRGDPRYVLSRKPDVIMIPQFLDPTQPQLPAVRALHDDPNFEAEYESVRIPPNGGFRRRPDAP